MQEAACGGYTRSLMLRRRTAGILLHPTSLPAHGGIGDLGPAAYEFVDFLAAARQGLWQILPLNPVGHGYSPYSSTSAFAGNPLLISLERLAERGMIARERIEALDSREGRVDYQRVMREKLPLLNEAAEWFLLNADGQARLRFERFCAQATWWLEDYVLFEALRRRNQQRSWNIWPQEFAHRQPQAMERLRAELHDELERARFLQFAFFEQWRALHAYCRGRGIKIIGDVAIFVSFDSADVWTHPDTFRLNEETLEPDCVAGVPPDAFSETGQRWGNPLYRWDVLADREYDWWVERIRRSRELYDIVRLDHFRGFEAYWSIPAEEETAINGKWVKAPGLDLFRVLEAKLGPLPLVAEDLGLITPEVDALRLELGMPGMRVLQFGFSDKGAHMHLPHQFEPRIVAYTGTHDNDTTQGWWKTAGKHDHAALEALVGPVLGRPCWPLIRAAAASVAQMAIFPVQDLLELGPEARMNTPSVPDGNWSWRLSEGSLSPQLAGKLAALVEVTDRDNDPLGRGAAASAQA